MSMHIYIAHSGEHLLADPVSFASYVLQTLSTISVGMSARLSSRYVNAC